MTQVPFEALDYPSHQQTIQEADIVEAVNQNGDTLVTLWGHNTTPAHVPDHLPAHRLKQVEIVLQSADQVGEARVALWRIKRKPIVVQVVGGEASGGFKMPVATLEFMQLPLDGDKGYRCTPSGNLQIDDVRQIAEQLIIGQVNGKAGGKTWVLGGY